MANYKLIDSIKTKYGFYGERVLNAGDPYKSLEEIDYITCDYDDMIDFVQELRRDGITIFKNCVPIKEKILPHDNTFFQSKFEEFKYYLGGEPRMFFAEIYRDNSPGYLETLVYNYYDGKNKEFDSLEDERDWKDLLDKIKLEFSRYKVFRGYLVYMDKYFKNHPELERVNLNPQISTTTNINTDDILEYDNEEFLT